MGACPSSNAPVNSISTGGPAATSVTCPFLKQPGADCTLAPSATIGTYNVTCTYAPSSSPYTFTMPCTSRAPTEGTNLIYTFTYYTVVHGGEGHTPTDNKGGRGETIQSSLMRRLVSGGQNSYDVYVGTGGGSASSNYQGGGYSALIDSSAATTVLVAGGGGGAARSVYPAFDTKGRYGYGGDAGTSPTFTGQDGAPGRGSITSGGKGASTSAAGIGGFGSTAQSGKGMVGGIPGPAASVQITGSGGGGLFGGGGGYAEGSGGGGSSMPPFSPYATEYDDYLSAGPAFVTISYLVTGCSSGLQPSLRARSMERMKRDNQQRDAKELACPATLKPCPLPSGNFECVEPFEVCD